MNRRRKVLAVVSTLLFLLPAAMIACEPDCGECRYWDPESESCELSGTCASVWACTSECQRCINCYCTDWNTKCHVLHDACWYCSNGVCINPCAAGQACINGQCVTVSIVNVTANKTNPTICENVWFTATTNPAGTSST